MTAPARGAGAAARSDAEAERAHERAVDMLDRQHLHTLAVNAAAAMAARELEVLKADKQLEAERIKAGGAAEDELNKLFHEKITEIAAAGVDRARDSAKFVQTAASAIFAVYAGLLALVYSVTDNPLPLRGAWAGVFLGLAVAFATAYLAFLTTVPPVRMRMTAGPDKQLQYARTALLTKWIKANVHRRTYATRAAVISLLFGVLFIAAPFVSTTVPNAAIPAPTPPAPPTEVDDAFEEPALRLFESQIEDYENAVAARAAALAAAEEAASERAADEDELNDQVTTAAGAALVIVLIGPVLYGGAERLSLWARAKLAARKSKKSPEAGIDTDT